MLRTFQMPLVYDLLNTDNPYFKEMVSQIYPTELHLNKANLSNTKAPFLELENNGIISSKIYNKRGNIDFEIVKTPFLDGDVPSAISYGVYISQLIRFPRICSNVSDQVQQQKSNFDR